MLISIDIACVTDASKRGFIHHASLTILGYPSRFCLYSKTKRLPLRLKLAPFEIEASFIGY